MLDALVRNGDDPPSNPGDDSLHLSFSMKGKWDHNSANPTGIGSADTSIETGKCLQCGKY
jgi:hypothetical protein